jgi:hypothetical protein
MIGKILAAILVIWLVCLAIGAGFHILGQIIWLAIVLSLISVAIGWFNRS